MSAQIVCENCMSVIPQDKRECPYCGRSFENTNPSNALAVATLLKDRYTVGKMLCEDSEGYLYSAICSKSMQTVLIKEFAPQNLCLSRSENGEVIAKDGYEVLFKTIRMDFKELYILLQRLNGTSGLNNVIDVFEINGTIYSVCEKINGITLREYIKARKTPLTSFEAVTLLKPLSNGIEALHRIGIIHRGISPDTIYICSDGAAILGGFATLGVRTLGSELEHKLYDGYAAPEQYSVAEFDGNYTDIYSFGAVFYFVLSGQDPKNARNRRQDDTLPTLKQLSHNVPSFVSSSVSRAMKIAPVERVQTATDLIETIARPQKTKLELTSIQKIIAASIGITIICIIVFTIVLVSILNGANPQSDLQPDSTSGTPTISEPETILAPNLVGKMYTDVQNDPDYLGVFHFPITNEYSTVFNKGEIISQNPVAGSSISGDGVIRLIVSSGPKTALMPEILGLDIEEATRILLEREIRYSIVYTENDGSYIPSTIAKTDVAGGTVIVVETDEVTIYVAKEMLDLPASSSLPAQE